MAARNAGSLLLLGVVLALAPRPALASDPGIEEDAAAALAGDGVEEVGILRIRSEPSGAAVLLGRHKVGRTPLVLRVAPGVHRLIVVLGGYVARSRKVRVGVDSDVRVFVSMVPYDIDPPPEVPADGGRPPGWGVRLGGILSTSIGGGWVAGGGMWALLMVGSVGPECRRDFGCNFLVWGPLAGGTVAMGVGLVLLVSGQSQMNAARADDRKAWIPALSPLPLVGGGGALTTWTF